MGRTKIPTYRLHRPSGQAVVTIDGRDRYLGRHGSPESRRKYDLAVSEWLASGRAVHGGQSAGGITCGEVARLYRIHAARYYVKRGRPTTRFFVAARVMDRWAGRCGELPLAAFGAGPFKDLRGTWVADGLCRRTVNDYAETVRRAVKWAYGEGLCPLDRYLALQAVPGLPRGRSEAPERAEVPPVSAEAVAATLEALAPVWRAVVEVQLATGMRPGEVLAMRPCDLSTVDTPWTYTPAEHKTEHRGRTRKIPLGPRARAALLPWLQKQPDPRGPIWHARTRTNPYRVKAYEKAVVTAARKAGVPHWTPNQLRHAAATRIGAAHGLEGSRAVLGHADPKVTLVYAAHDYEVAARIAEEMG